jgi:hypothetical protein
MGVAVGTKLAASSVCHQSPLLPVGTQVTGRARVAAEAPDGMAAMDETGIQLTHL